MAKCPYCEQEMISGKIYGDRYQLKWMPNTNHLILGTWVKSDYIPVGESGYLVSRPRVEADYCKKCHKMIIDL